MAVVKSPKNTKRKNLWVKSLQKTNTTYYVKRDSTTNFKKSNIHSYRKLVFRKRNDLVVNYLPPLTTN